MELIDDILKSIDAETSDDIRAGLKYTAVRIEDRVGLAYAFSDFHSPPKNVGNLLGTNTLPFAKSWNITEASIGIASINALLKPRNYKVMNIVDRILAIAHNYDKIGVVGRFPFIDSLGKDVFVFERRPMHGALPDTAAETLLPKCDLIVISGSTFVNKTLQRLLELSDGYTFVIGPTTPLTPILLEYGADVIAGAIVNDAEKALEIVSQGGGTPNLKSVVEFVCMGDVKL
ncbi:Rossmann-like domain-containing protein [Halobacteriota archaeon]